MTSRTRVRAKLHLTQEDEYSSLAWHGTVFVNPPYGPALAAWVAKARRDFEDGRAKAVDYFLRGRLRFGAGKQRAPFPSALAIGGGAGPEALAAPDAALPGAWRAG